MRSSQSRLRRKRKERRSLHEGLTIRKHPTHRDGRSTRCHEETGGVSIFSLQIAKAKQIFVEINPLQRRDALHPGSWLPSLHRKAELRLGATTTACFQPEDRERLLVVLSLIASDWC